MKTSHNICLIGGTGRCGTTILKKIFHEHPQVAHIPEWRITLDPDGLIDFYMTLSEGWSPYLFDIKLKRLQKLLQDAGRSSAVWNPYRLVLKKFKIQKIFPFHLSPRYSDFSIKKVCPEYSSLVKELTENLKKFEYRGDWTGQRFFTKRTIQYAPPWGKDDLADVLGRFLGQVIQNMLDKQGKQIFVEDNTWNILWFDKFLELMPQAKLIHIYRDPRDVVASFTKQTWTPTDPSRAALFYNGIMERWWEIHKHLPKKSYMEISLENLVQAPEAVTKEICRFWNIPWHNSLLKTDLSRSHSGRWKKDLNPDDQDRIQTILSDTMDKLGYKK
jgi:hypothetical protein